MVRNMEDLAMKADQTNSVGVEKLDSDLKEFRLAAKKLVNDAVKLGGLGFGTNLIQWFASGAAIYLLVLNRTNWKTDMLTSLLLPYIFLSLPSVLFSFLSGEVGKWIAFIAVVLRLFFPSRFPEWLEMPASLILLLVVAPSFCSDTLRKSLAGLIICLAIGCYLLHQHINASGGFRNSFTKTHGVSNSIGIILLMVYPLWAFVVLFPLVLPHLSVL